MSLPFAQQRPRLAQAFEAGWRQPLVEYARPLFSEPPRLIDPDFLALVEAQSLQIGYPKPWVSQLLLQLGQTPVLQTSHHLTPTHGPTFTAIDLISLAGLQKTQIYPIFATSGVPFSNSAWSGALSYGQLDLAQLLEPTSGVYRKAQKAQAERQSHGKAEQRLSLIGANWRDHLVFSAPLSASMKSLWGQFSPELKSLLPEPKIDQPWAFWAARCAAEMQSTLFGRPVMVLDMSGLVAGYLAVQLRKQDPLFVSLFADPFAQERLGFMAAYRGKKSWKLCPVNWVQGQLVGGKSGLGATSLPELAALLESRQLCPAVWLSFWVLRFVLGFKCLGGFNQTAYLEDFRVQLLSSPWNPELRLEPQQTDLTTGRLGLDGHWVWPLDHRINQKTLSITELQQRPMSFFWQPIVDQLSGS